MKRRFGPATGSAPGRTPTGTLESSMQSVDSPA